MKEVLKFTYYLSVTVLILCLSVIGHKSLKESDQSEMLTQPEAYEGKEVYVSGNSIDQSQHSERHASNISSRALHGQSQIDNTRLTRNSHIDFGRSEIYEPEQQHLVDNRAPDMINSSNHKAS